MLLNISLATASTLDGFIPWDAFQRTRKSHNENLSFGMAKVKTGAINLSTIGETSQGSNNASAIGSAERSDHHVKFPLGLPAKAKPRSTSNHNLLKILIWALLIFGAVHLSAYGRLSSSFVNPVSSMVTFGFWCSPRKSRPWVGLLLLLATIGGFVVGMANAIVGIMLGALAFVAGIVPYYALNALNMDQTFTSRKSMAGLVLSSVISATISSLSYFLPGDKLNPGVNIFDIFVYFLLNYSVWLFGFIGIFSVVY